MFPLFPLLPLLVVVPVLQEAAINIGITKTIIKYLNMIKYLVRKDCLHCEFTENMFKLKYKRQTQTQIPANISNTHKEFQHRYL